MKEENSGAISDPEPNDDAVRKKFVELIATIVVDKIFKKHVPKESNRLHKDIQGQAK